MTRWKRQIKAAATVKALREYNTPPILRPSAESQLPIALLKHGQFATVGAGMRLLGIDSERYERESRRGLLDVFRVNAALYVLEVPRGHPGPESDFLLEAV